MFLLKNIKLFLHEGEDALYEKVAKKLLCKRENITEIKIIKKSIDARKKPCFIYTVAAGVKNGKSIKGEKYIESAPVCIKKTQFGKRPVVIGFGPAGIFAAYFLAKAGARPIIIERGRDADKRAEDIKAFRLGAPLNENSNICYGEGGAGTFSDGKLTTGIGSVYVKEVLKIFAEHGAPEDILYSSKPHVGSDILPLVIKNMRSSIKSMGGEVHFDEKLVSFKTHGGKISSVVTDKAEYETDYAVLAIGHSARETFEMLYSLGVNMEAKPFSVGARIEHRQKDISFSQYGKSFEMLPAADYKLSVHTGGASIYTFCMCPGGYVVNSSSQKGEIVTNGYSLRARSGENANSAILVAVSPQSFGLSPLAGIAFQRGIEKSAYDMSMSYKAPCQLVGDFLKKKPTTGLGDIEPTYDKGVVPGDIGCCLPSFITEAMREGIRAFANKIKGFDRYDAVLTAPETRSSSPVKILRDENMESNIKGLYPIGEGSGYAGGITSSAVDGINAALKIVERNKK